MWRVAAVAVIASMLTLPSQPVTAQTFGNAPPVWRLYRYPTARPNPPTVPPTRSPYVRRWPGFFGDPEPDRDESGGVGGGSYRTLCVRLCDGYYFPISGATGSGGLARDADLCASSCATETRLFYQPSGEGDVAAAVDLTGMGYSALPNAFKYRTTLVPECRCRPQPWSQSELQRHQDYAGGRSTAAAPITTSPPGLQRAGVPDEQSPSPARSAAPGTASGSLPYVEARPGNGRRSIYTGPAGSR
jgi:hypothetical protein